MQAKVLTIKVIYLVKQKIFVGVGVVLFLVLLVGNLSLANRSYDSARAELPLYPNVTVISTEPKRPSEGVFSSTDSFERVLTFYSAYFEAAQNGWRRYNPTQGCGTSTADLATLCYAKGKTSVGIEIKRDGGSTHITAHAADE